MIVGAFSLAKANASHTIFAPSPMYIWTNEVPESFKNVAFVYAAHALASKVLPVPGGPNIKHPFGGLIPNFANHSLWVIGNTIASINSSIYLSSPPISL